MSQPHVIRLREPWECAPAAHDKAVVWRRRFGRPTGLNGGERVWLCIRCASELLAVHLNDVEQLGESCGELWRVDITAQLAVRNVLEVSAASSAGGPAFEAWLEITSQ